MAQHYPAPVICSWDMDDCLQIQQDVNDLESFDPKKGCYSDNWKWVYEECDGGDDVAKMGEMLGTGERLGVQRIEAIYLEGKWEAFHRRRGIFFSSWLDDEFEYG